MLPLEAKQAIMAALPDVGSLRSMALTCSSFYDAFIAAETLITSQVLLNEVGHDVLPEAIAALESSHLMPWTRQRVQYFVFQHLHIRRPPSQGWALSDALLITFNDIAEHDIEWGHFCVEYGYIIDSEFMQHVLSRGLASLHQIILADTYEARHKLLHSGLPPYHEEFLYEGLKAANDPDDRVFLCDYTQDDELAHIKSPFIQDSDTGPSDAWRWAHQNQTCKNFVYSNSQQPLRNSGYVMWDCVRLNKWNIFQKPWEAFYVADEAAQRSAEMRVSFDQRSKIYVAGGRGWWSLEDQSQIIWTVRVNLYDSHVTRNDQSQIIWPVRVNLYDSHVTRNEHHEVKSLSEAREFLASLKCPSLTSKTLN
ncbi:hypothetical protein B7463_g715, partial [Scytalidium lignicola]